MGCPEPDTFNALVANTLDSQVRASIVDHAATCAECHQMLAALLELSAAPAVDAGTPERIGRYVIERRLGAGAMGVVYCAFDPELQRRVAIKVLRGGGSASRLRREAQLLARLRHPNVVAVYDVGEHDGQTFVAMELVDGENLRSWLANPHPTDVTVRIVRDAASGLAAAHAAGLIHRDLKPDNIFVGDDGTVQVGDFGLARSDGELDAAASVRDLFDLTQTGAVLGTPAYMAPEHADGEPTVASDQFSFCVTAWEALYGARPFAAKTYAELRTRIEAGELAPTPDSRRVPARIRAALERGLRADPAQRFPSIDSLRAALGPPRRRWPFVAGGLLSLAAVGIAIGLTVASSHSAVDACRATASELDDTWTAAARATFASAKPIVDSYAHDWIALRRDACLAGNASGDPRMTCLDRAREALRSLVASVTPATDPDQLHAAVLALPPLGDCRTALRGSASPMQQQAGEQLRKQIDAAELGLALSGTGKLEDIHALVATATALGYEPAIIDASTTEAEALARGSQPDAAADVLRHAMATAEANHDDLGVARVAHSLAQIVIKLGKLDEARSAIELATAALARAGGDPELEVFVTNVRAELASATGDHATAIGLARGLLAPMTARTGAHSPELTSLYLLLAREYSASGNFEETSKALEQARLGDLARAQSGGVKDLVTIANKQMLAFQAGDAPRAITLSREYVAVAHEMHERSAEIAAAIALARSYEIDDNGRMMVEAYRGVLDLVEHDPGSGGDDVQGEANEGIGRGWLQLGKPEQALEPLRKAVEIDRKPGLATDYASAAVALGGALVTTGKPHEARELLEPVVRKLVDDPDALLQRRAGAEFGLARALWDDGGAPERARARTLADDAVRDFRAALATVKPGGLRLMVTHIETRLAEIAAWQQRRSANP